MIVQIRLNVSLGLPSTMSWAFMFLRWTRCSYRKLSALPTFSDNESHLAFCGAGQALSGENLKELDEHLVIAEVGVEIGDLVVGPHKVRVYPLRERLFAHALARLQEL